MTGTMVEVTGPDQGWTLRRRVIALCLLAAAVLGFLAAGATTTALANRGQLDSLLGEIGPMRTGVGTLGEALADQEAGIRGFVISGDPKDLAHYTAGVAAEEEQLRAIITNPGATDEILAQAHLLGVQTKGWRAEFAEPAIVAVRAGDRVGAEALLGDAARARFDSVEASLDGLRETIQRVRDDSVANVRDTSTTLLFVLIVAVILVLASGVSLLVALQRTVIAPVTGLAAQVRAVAGGQYNRRIGSDGPPELQRLAQDVDQMRRRIAADLAEVRSARRALEEAHDALARQAAELTRSNRDLEQFAYVASHDLQEPLRKVASFCQLLQRRYQGQLDERADQYIAFAVSGAQRMQRLINDLLAFSRIGRSTTGFSDVNLDRLAADTVAQLDSTLDSAEADVTWSDLPTVRGEEPLLAMLLTNLVGNSVKFRRPDAPARVHLSGRRVHDAWEITCADNGIGIDPAYAEKVFVIFQRLNARDAYPGTGIGLALAKKIVEFHGGEIWVDTEGRTDGPSDGATIRFTLPVAATPVVFADLTANAGEATADSDDRWKEPVP
jgi:signal transduction histidine kinase